jgi:hypothetical protein
VPNPSQYYYCTLSLAPVISIKILYSLHFSSCVLHCLHITGFISYVCWRKHVMMLLVTNSFSTFYYFMSPVQIFSSAACSQIPSVYIFHLISDTTICTHTQPQQNCSFVLSRVLVTKTGLGFMIGFVELFYTHTHAHTLVSLVYHSVHYSFLSNGF